MEIGLTNKIIEIYPNLDSEILYYLSKHLIGKWPQLNTTTELRLVNLYQLAFNYPFDPPTPIVGNRTLKPTKGIKAKIARIAYEFYKHDRLECLGFYEEPTLNEDNFYTRTIELELLNIRQPNNNLHGYFGYEPLTDTLYIKQLEDGMKWK